MNLHVSFTRTWIFERDDGSEVLFTLYDDDNPPEMAERSDNSAIWGPPITGILTSEGH